MCPGVRCPGVEPLSGCGLEFGAAEDLQRLGQGAEEDLPLQRCADVAEEDRLGNDDDVVVGHVRRVQPCRRDFWDAAAVEPESLALDGLWMSLALTAEQMTTPSWRR
ncbi:hypothetical protein [Streptomyces sp. NPDC001450]